MPLPSEPVRILLTAFGSRGDVSPRVALGQELAGRGHVASIACASRYQQLVASAGLDALSIGEYPSDDRLARVFAQIAVDPDPGRRGETLLRELLVPMLPQLRQALLRIEGEYDLVVLNDLLAVCAVPPFIDLNRLAVTLTTQPVGPFARMLRASPCVKLVGSPAMLLPDHHGLDASFEVHGFWLADPPGAVKVDPMLERFLSPTDRHARGAPQPVVAVALGSASGTDPRMDHRMLARAASMAGVRLVIQDLQVPFGTSTPSLDGGLITVGDVSYAWLFERVDAVVHHGGAGTVAEVLRARRPSVTVPHYGDHVYWGHRLEALGLSAGTVMPRDVDEARLAERMHDAVHNARLRRDVDAAGARLCTRDAVRTAATTLEQLARQTRLAR